jgi:isocitrate/isopropylmalate dehydrogenase
MTHGKDLYCVREKKKSFWPRTGKADVKDRQQESRVDGVYPASEVDTILAPNLTEATSSQTHRVTCFGWLK